MNNIKWIHIIYCETARYYEESIKYWCIYFILFVLNNWYNWLFLIGNTVVWLSTFFMVVDVADFFELFAVEDIDGFGLPVEIFFGVTERACVE